MEKKKPKKPYFLIDGGKEGILPIGDIYHNISNNLSYLNPVDEV